MTQALRERGFVPRRSLWELDHIVPLVDGGSHDPSNLQTLCTPCHAKETAALGASKLGTPWVLINGQAVDQKDLPFLLDEVCRSFPDPDSAPAGCEGPLKGIEAAAKSNK